MRKMLVVLSIAMLSFSVFSAFSAPREIVLIRHADKWDQKNAGPFLSSKGQLRAERFAVYYLKYFHKPDYIFATKVGDSVNLKESESMRPLQTVAPLANQLAYDNPKGFSVNTSYFNEHYVQLAQILLKNSLYKNKMILICWHHGRINQLAQALGATESLKKWPANNYDSVYVLKYNVAGKLISFQILNHQYPVNSNPTWKFLADK